MEYFTLRVKIDYKKVNVTQYSNVLRCASSLITNALIYRTHNIEADKVG